MITPADHFVANVPAELGQMSHILVQALMGLEPGDHICHMMHYVATI